MTSEVPLNGGNVSAGVVRVGDTVRKPATDATPAVLAFLGHLEEAGYEGSPRALGRDDDGRVVLEYVAGVVAEERGLLSLDDLHRVGGLIRRLHDLSESFRPPPDAHWDVVIPPDHENLVVHHDLAPWNLVLSDDRWVFIDWDNAGPGSRLWDLAYAAHGFVGMAAGNDPRVDGRRLAALAEGYGLEPADRTALVALLPRRIRSMHDLLVEGHRSGRQPWSDLYVLGHGDHWGAAADYAQQHLDTLGRAIAAR